MVGEHTFADHHRFSAAEWAAARAAAARSSALLVVSAKDAARLTRAQREGAHVLPVTWTWMAGAEAIERRIDVAMDVAVERAGAGAEGR